MKTLIDPLSLGLLLELSLPAVAQVRPGSLTCFGEYGSVADPLNMLKGTPGGGCGWVPSVSGGLKDPVLFVDDEATSGVEPVPIFTLGWLMDDWFRNLFDTSGTPNPRELIPWLLRQTSLRNLNAVGHCLLSFHPNFNAIHDFDLFANEINSLDRETPYSHL